MMHATSQLSTLRRALCAALIAGQCWPVALRAQLSASAGASPGQKPQVTTTASGMPMVYIAPPNGGGLSNNQFHEFNVPTGGLIFNNATRDTRTQLAGYVQANPGLLSGSASVILAQVNGGLPSNLLGYLEVAGRQAEVVIANPAGMVCNGCGFINTARAVMTTGRPAFGADGSLSGLSVGAGIVRVGERGLDGTGVDRVDLISRSVQVNGKLWAKNSLQVITGANEVSYDGQQVRARADDGRAGPAPALAIDVALLGGMYAGRIRLVGTEAGVGVNSKGSLIASSGDFTLDQAGRVVLAGSTEASGNVSVRASSLNNSGLLAAGRRVDIQGDTLTNTGAIVGSSLSAQATTRIVNSGPSALIAATGRAGALELLAPVVHNRDDSTATDTPASASIVGLGKVVIAGGRNAQGQYTSATVVLNQSASIESGADISIHATTLTNQRRAFRLSSDFTQAVPKEVLDRLGISLSGRVGYINMPFSEAALQPGGAYIDPPHGGRMNSDYYDTLYNGTVLGQGIEAISPQAQMLAGGDFYAHVGTLNNNYSQISAGGNVHVAEGARVNQLSALQQIQITYTGTYNYQTYKQEQWSWSFCDNGCNKGSDLRYATQSAYNAGLTANNRLSGNGLALNNRTVAQQPAQGSAIVPQANARDWLSRLSVPGNGGLYTVVPSPSSSYLVNTNPAFTDHNRFVSSDYYFSMMGVNPAQIQKRLGDAYYEQQLVQGQILQLTGRKVLSGYADTQAEYTALMTAGAELALSLQLAPGVSLSAGQVRQLTRNVVILQEQVVSGQKVLVPVVYLASASQRDLGGGALVVAADVNLTNATVVSNSGQIVADQNLTLSAQHLDNQGGRLGSGQQMALTTAGDMNLTGANVNAGTLALEAGGNVNLSAETHTRTQSGAWGTRSTTVVGPQASIEVDRDASLKVGGNLTQNAGAIKAGGNLNARVDGTWALGTATANETQSIDAPGTHAEAHSNNLVGSSVRVGGNTRIAVGQDLVAQGADISLQGGTVQAQGSIRLEAAQTTSTAHSTHQSKGSDGLNSTSHFDERNTSDQSTLTTQLQSGGQLTLAAGKDVQVLGSSVTLSSEAQGQGALSVTAGRDVVVGAVSEQHHFDQTNAGDVSKPTTRCQNFWWPDTRSFWRADRLG